MTYRRSLNATASKLIAAGKATVAALCGLPWTRIARAVGWTGLAGALIAVPVALRADGPGALFYVSIAVPAFVALLLRVSRSSLPDRRRAMRALLVALVGTSCGVFWATALNAWRERSAERKHVLAAFVLTRSDLSFKLYVAMHLMDSLGHTTDRKALLDGQPLPDMAPLVSLCSDPVVRRYVLPLTLYLSHDADALEALRHVVISREYPIEARMARLQNYIAQIDRLRGLADAGERYLQGSLSQAELDTTIVHTLWGPSPFERPDSLMNMEAMPLLYKLR